MPLQITFLGHAGFLLESDNNKVAIDPFLTGNPLAKHKPADIKCDTLVLTHGHSDHIADAPEIAKNNNATVVAPFEVCGFLGEQGVESTAPLNPGGQLDTGFGFVAFTQAIHSSSCEGRYMGACAGAVVNMGGHTFYHLGDTTIFSSMKLMGEIYKPDIAAVPIGDRFTMGPKIASRAVDLINPQYAIPIHYKTFPLLKQSADGFVPKSAKVKEMEPGETWLIEN